MWWDLIVLACFVYNMYDAATRAQRTVITSNMPLSKVGEFIIRWDATLAWFLATMLLLEVMLGGVK